MSQSFEALFDGSSFHPDKPVKLEPNTRVELTIQSVKRAAKKKKAKSWLEIARSAKLKGPPDWSTNLDAYLYHGKKLP